MREVYCAETKEGGKSSRGAEKKRERGGGDLLIYTENDVTQVRVGSEPPRGLWD